MPKCEIRIGHYLFAPRFTSTILVLAILPLLLSLGFWQLDRAQQKRSMLQQFQARHHMMPVSLTALKKQNDIRYLPVQVQGYFDNAHSILLDNQFYQHQVGYYVLTPFFPDINQPAVLINRGWIPRTTNRLQLPSIPPLSGMQKLTGIVQLPTAKPFTLGSLADNQTWPWRIEALVINKIQQRLGYKVAPFVILLDPTQAGGFARDWRPVNTEMPPQRHVAYAVQWFALALTLTILYLIITIKR